MRGEFHSDILVATRSPALSQGLEASLRDCGCRIVSVGTADAAVEAMRGGVIPGLVLLDVELLGAELDRVLAGMNAGGGGRRFPIVLVCDGETAAWRDRLEEGVIDDLIPGTLTDFHWRVRVEVALRAFRERRELERVRQTAAELDRDTDAVTGLCTREALLSVLFRETDRVQRMNTPLSLMVFEVDDFEHWRRRLKLAGWDELVQEVVARIRRLLRAYDVFARTGAAAFALCLPGCALVNAVTLAERIRMEVFNVPFQARGWPVQMTVSFGIAPSHGRSPLVVMRGAERALRMAQAEGAESIRSSQEESEGRRFAGTVKGAVDG